MNNSLAGPVQITALLILLGASLGVLACREDPTGGPGGGDVERYHPDGYLEPELHGMDAKLQEDACLDCHGADLNGGTSERSCDPCHDDDWRTNCTFCHGGEETDDGAPPRDIRGTTAHDKLSFPPHTAHVTTELREPLECSDCHGEKPEDVLSSGHFLVGDDSPGRAEVDLSSSLSDQGEFTVYGGCSNMYCHGNGQGHNGEIDRQDDEMQCDSCHPSIESSNSDWGDMSGMHKKHLREDDISCADCHGLTTQDNESISEPANHINGSVQLSLPDGIEVDDLSCEGSCHDEDHDDGEHWIHGEQEDDDDDDDD